ncbi:MAG: sugar phosphate nucleotidyltransferase [Tepidisphaeraceae bacterium]
MHKAVILAAGLGTRMRKAEEGAALSAEQAKAAATGVKALMPVDGGRPFLDYVLTALADAGYREACLVIGPTHSAVRDYYSGPGAPKRIKIDYAIQQTPKGTADAVRAAEAFAVSDPFVMINSDNYYPVEALRGLRELSGNGLAAFERDAMLKGNIPAERIEKFAAIEIDSAGHMKKVHEKPEPATLARLGTPLYCSMNCWRFGSSVFEACKKIAPSPRGEYEVTDAAQYTIDVLHEPMTAVKVALPVLDMSSRGDVASVVSKLKGMAINY